MSLVDRTNERIELSMELPAGLDLVVDADFDSSFTPSDWIWLEFDPIADEVESHAWRLTHEEAGLLHDRLGLILGRSGTEVGQ